MTARVEVLAIDSQKPFATFSTVCRDSAGTVLMEGTATVMLPRELYTAWKASKH
jgi:hypothetical protein